MDERRRRPGEHRHAGDADPVDPVAPDLLAGGVKDSLAGGTLVVRPILFNHRSLPGHREP